VKTPTRSASYADTRAADAGIRDEFNRGPLVAPAGDVALEPVPEERRILSIFGEAKRKGRWLVPRLLRVRAYFADVKVDLRDNPIPQDFTFDVGAFAASVTLIVPPGVNVVFDVFAAMATATSEADEPLSNSTLAPWIRVTGSVFMGEVKVVVKDPHII
jgi:hypothetical protein